MITPRLEMILRHIKGDSCADIGTDHAYIPIRLAEKGMYVIATDIKAGPLKMGEENAIKYGQKIDFRLGGGLSPIEKGEVETIVIAGMGGEMIEKIISEEADKARSARLVLQPMNSQYELRKYLAKNNFTILEEDLAVEGFKVYNLMVVRSGEGNIYDKEIDAHLPKQLYSHPLFEKLLEKKKRELGKIYDGLIKSSADTEKEATKIKLLLEDIYEIERSRENEAL